MRHGLCSEEFAGSKSGSGAGRKDRVVSQETKFDVVSPQEKPGARRRRRVAAAGKALLVWLGTGSLGAAIVAFIIFKWAGC